MDLSILMMMIQHVMGHHVYTNTDGYDPDIMTAAPGSPDIRRIKESSIGYLTTSTSISTVLCFTV